MAWDKDLTVQIKSLGIDVNAAMQIVGLIAEQRQIADREGYTRGFEDGFAKQNNNFDNKERKRLSKLLEKIGHELDDWENPPLSEDWKNCHNDNLGG